MINQTPPRILALAPKSLEGIGIVAAACRASALGIVDLGSDPPDTVVEAFRQISRLAGAPYGVHLDANYVLGASWLADATPLLSVVCVRVRSGGEVSFETAVRAIHETGRLVLGAQRRKPEIRARRLRPESPGLIVAGCWAGGWGELESSFVLAGGSLPGKPPGLGARWNWAQCRGGLCGSGSSGCRS